MFKKLFGVLVALLIATAPLAAETINGAGASFPFPAYSTWAYYYQKATGVKLNYQSIGSGGGVQQITNKTVEFGATDEPMKPEKLKENEMIQFPAIMGGVVLVVNIEGLKEGELKLSGDLVARIFLGDIKKWNDPAIAAINKGVKLPNADITVVHRSDGSGTTAIFTEYLSGVSKAWKEKVGAGKAVDWPVGLGGKKNDGVANYVKRVENSIGYVEFAYAKKNKLPYTLLKNSAGEFVEPNFETFKAAAASAQWDKEKGYYLWLVNAPGKDSWPIAGASFILLRKDQPEANNKVAKFFQWCFENGDQAAESLIYIPLPQNLKESIRGYWKENGITY